MRQNPQLRGRSHVFLQTYYLHGETVFAKLDETLEIEEVPLKCT